MAPNQWKEWHTTHPASPTAAPRTRGRAHHHMKNPGRALAFSSAPASCPAFTPSSSLKLHTRDVRMICVHQVLSVSQRMCKHVAWQQTDSIGSHGKGHNGLQHALTKPSRPPTSLPSVVATRPLKCSLPSACLYAYPVSGNNTVHAKPVSRWCTHAHGAWCAAATSNTQGQAKGAATSARGLAQHQVTPALHAPAMGVRQDPSRAVRNARSVATATRVSSWFKLARYFWADRSLVRHAMPMAPCARVCTRARSRLWHPCACAPFAMACCCKGRTRADAGVTSSSVACSAQAGLRPAHLRHGRQHFLDRDDARDVLRHVEALEPGQGQQRGGARALFQLA